MQIPIKKLTNGFEIPSYGMGLSRMGGSDEADYSQDEEWVQAIKGAINSGITHFDTAEVYGAGHNEELLGQAIKGADRSKLFIASKVWASHQTYDGIMKACEDSLKRLGTDYLDLYTMHSFPEPDKPIAKAMRALTELVDQGVIKNIGASNFTINRLQAAQDISPHKIVCNQLHYNVKFREPEHRGILKYCQDNDVFLVAWKPLQRGALSEATILDELAAKYGKTWRQVAINWLISQKNVVTICKASSPDHLNENLGALDWKMSSEDIENIRNEFPDQEVIGNWPLNYDASEPA